MAIEDIERLFPVLAGGNGYQKTSEENDGYNCFAWALGITDKRFDPTEWPDCYWPDGLTKSAHLSSFVELYTSHGFETCDNRELEPGFLKIALYKDNLTGEAMHAARQLPDGEWTSKIGDYDDISHDTLESLEGYYGVLVNFMRKRI